MISFPNCKINLGLHIIAKRSDGYHDLETIFYPLNIFDGLEVIAGPEQEGNDIKFTTSGLQVEGGKENICIKAYRLLKKDFPQLPPVSMHLHKNIPLGAGLGGGSSDGASALKLINDKFQLGLNTDQLIDYALGLGSDCPFFIFNNPSFATGRGEKMEPVSVDLSGYQLQVVHPGIHINTGWAFSQITPEAGRPSLRQIIARPVSEWRSILTNDFEWVVFKQYPEIENIKNRMYEAGAIYSSMSGSGSSVYGLYNRSASLPVFPADYFVKVL